ncbi:MFS transporter [Phormidesmis sp. 146-33]
MDLVNSGTIATVNPFSTESPESSTGTEPVFPIAAAPETKIHKDAIRKSLRASTLDGVFATVFSNITGGVLLSNFLVELHASPVEIGLSASIPMLANLIQPLGAYLGDRTTSRHNYCFWIYVPARLIWLLLVAVIGIASWQQVASHSLVLWTLTIVFLTNFLGALGGASWLSWLAALVPRRLRGRYFSLRNSAANLTSLVCVPLAGLMVSHYPRGAIEGYGIVLLLGIIFGLVSLGYQWLMTDVNPREQRGILETLDETPVEQSIEQSVEQPVEQTVSPILDDRPSVSTSELAQVEASPESSQTDQPFGLVSRLLGDRNFLKFLIYFSVWMFAVNLSAPFFNLYMLDDLGLDVSCVTIYNSLTAGANLVMLLFWGKLADRFGNRSLLLLVGILVAVTPLLWLGTGTDTLSVWLWLPLLHVLAGGTWAAIDLCNNNIQLGIAPVKNQSVYFAVAAAIAGVSGALGTTAGGFLAELADYGGLPGLFALSSVVRLVALLPLVFVQEDRQHSIRQMLKMWLPFNKSQDLVA